MEKRQEIKAWIDDTLNWAGDNYHKYYQAETFTADYGTAMAYAYEVFIEENNESDINYTPIVVIISSENMPEDWENFFLMLQSDTTLPDVVPTGLLSLASLRRYGVKIIVVDTRTAEDYVAHDGFSKLAEYTDGYYVETQKDEEIQEVLRKNLEQAKGKSEASEGEVSSQDLDHDGLNDSLESKGIPDQYNSVWKTERTGTANIL